MIMIETTYIYIYLSVRIRFQYSFYASVIKWNFFVKYYNGKQTYFRGSLRKIYLSFLKCMTCQNKPNGYSVS